MNILVLGPQGSGKGTQAKLIRSTYGLAHIATGDMIREIKELSTDLGRELKAVYDRGDLVSDELMIRLIEDRLSRGDTLPGFILDGFPRTIEQAKALDKQLTEMGRRVTAAILVDVPDQEVVRRISGRRLCVKSGHNYHVDFDPPKREGVCDQDGSRLIQRDDDKDEVVRNRLKVYHDQTEPLIDYFDDQGLMRRIDGTRSPAEVHDHIRAVIATLRMEDDV